MMGTYVFENVVGVALSEDKSHQKNSRWTRFHIHAYAHPFLLVSKESAREMAHTRAYEVLANRNVVPNWVCRKRSKSNTKYLIKGSHQCSFNDSLSLLKVLPN